MSQIGKVIIGADAFEDVKERRKPGCKDDKLRSAKTTSRSLLSSPTPTTSTPSPRILTQPTLELSSLWNVSLVGCPLSTLAVNLKGLSDLAALGLLDLSFTDIDLVTLQTSLRPLTAILRLHLFGCHNLFSPSKGVDAGFVPAGAPGSIGSRVKRPVSSLVRVRSSGLNNYEDDGSIHLSTPWEEDEEVRGFVNCALPNVWTLNGVLVAAGDRRRWADHFFGIEGKGRWSVLVRKLFVPFKKIGPSNDVEQGMKGSPAFSSPDMKLLENAIRVCSIKVQEKVWNDASRSILRGIPAYFHMSADEDKMKIGRLALDLLRRVSSNLKEVNLGYRETINDAVLSILDQEDLAPSSKSNVPPITTPQENDQQELLSGKIAHRVNLFILLFASLFSIIPRGLIQSSLEDAFGSHSNDLPYNKPFLKEDWNSDGQSRICWTHRILSPVYWRIQERLAYLGLLSAVLHMDLQSGEKSLLTSGMLHYFLRKGNAATLAFTRRQELLYRITLFPLSIHRVFSNANERLNKIATSNESLFDWEQMQIDFDNILDLDRLFDIHKNCPDEDDQTTIDSFQDDYDDKEEGLLNATDYIVPLLLLESIVFISMNGSFREPSMYAFVGSASHLIDVIRRCLLAIQPSPRDYRKWMSTIENMSDSAKRLQHEILPYIKIDRKLRQRRADHKKESGLSVDGSVLEFRARLVFLTDSILEKFTTD
ncbi:hypothetical protein HDU67_007329 [Dinochytrium kinnereticum]|nr:hypothetical protein HDU67_007329 [Dinochytrium kinnereticum]